MKYCLIAIAAFGALSARAQTPIVFDLRTPAATAKAAPPAAKPAAPRPAAKPPAAGKRAAPKTRVASLPSTARAAARTLAGRIGTIAQPNTPIYDGPYQRKVYNVCQPGQPVILTGWNSYWYGVRMIDGRTGWVPRAFVRLEAATVRVPEIAPRKNGQGIQLVGVHPLLRAAFAYMGIPYRWGGTSSNGIDCSGFVRSVYRKFGVELPRVARDQAKVGVPVPLTPASLRPGDRLYFACNHKYIDHTGIYWGNGLMIHSSGGRGVNISPLWDGGTYERGLVSARRTFAPAS